ISEYSRREWGGEGKIIHHGIDTSVFTNFGWQRENKSLTVCNDFINRQYFCGYNEWEQATAGLDRTVVGKTPGLSEPARSIDHLVEIYNSHLIYINTSLVSPIPTSM